MIAHIQRLAAGVTAARLSVYCRHSARAITVPVSPAQIVANTQLMLRPGISREWCQEVKVRAAGRQDMMDRKAKGHYAAVITTCCLLQP